MDSLEGRAPIDPVILAYRLLHRQWTRKWRNTLRP